MFHAIFEAVSLTLGRAPWIFALIPSLVVLEHMVFLWYTKPTIPNAPDDRHKGPTKQAFEATRETIDSNFGTRALLLRYLAPAMLVGLVAVSVLNALFVGPARPPSGLALTFGGTVLPAAQLGAMGAYFWVLLYLARRTIRHDLTSGGAMVCSLTLVLGPVLSGVLGYLLAGAKTEATVWGEHALFFAAGMAPRRFAEALLDALRRLWAPEQATVPPPARLTPLSQVRGITPDIEERLGEEGIYDATTLAMADPVRLFRNTSFELRQILWWMDEALLILFVPEAWAGLQKNGLTGAIDLAWSSQFGAEASRESGTPDPLFENLVTGTNISAALLQQVSERMFEDAQVQIVWVLYQTGYQLSRTQTE